MSASSIRRTGQPTSATSPPPQPPRVVQRRRREILRVRRIRRTARRAPSLIRGRFSLRSGWRGKTLKGEVGGVASPRMLRGDEAPAFLWLSLKQNSAEPWAVLPLG